MLYFGTVQLRMSEDRFWGMTPRKYRALAMAAMDYQNLVHGAAPEEEGKEPKFGYIDQIPGW